ncbi:serine/threonine protein kinase Ppk8 [Schizosaccharomyces pombe]|uniref:Serine/threonine-protein kinase ppk8 n=1 Tax=Schizosaccharomyces pombe (strain 972 / ATCC 24843) TaxID=284812 RepID=PPK8_SCHPO|nr:putative serine/threonine protein kinase Ppk8 [Schizosaccharomyces pombe]Q09792.1 RecName: Full=Serine/threonine-protein kinase ppk8 [Schizosaccharomyces pombe 972h-]CAA91132.1 serine/threonine protein kinase Ppk8 (predicted) [Schizosaccharomyces pombe]|eukprot:NP_593057.1 putative serine/threonine protein kinase Ppk8 [Schizosaccharomyces pombe]
MAVITEENSNNLFCTDSLELTSNKQDDQVISNYLKPVRSYPYIKYSRSSLLLTASTTLPENFVISFTNSIESEESDKSDYLLDHAHSLQELSTTHSSLSSTLTSMSEESSSTESKFATLNDGINGGNPYSRLYRKNPSSDPNDIPPQFHFKKKSKSFYSSMYDKMKIRINILPNGNDNFIKKRNSGFALAPIACYNHTSDLRKLLKHKVTGSNASIFKRINPRSRKRVVNPECSVTDTPYGKLNNVIGEGASSFIRVINDRNKLPIYVAKVFRPPLDTSLLRRYVRYFIAEYTFASTLRHPNIIKVLDIIYKRHTILQIIEYVPYDLFTFITKGHCSALKADQMFFQLLDGVAYMHSLGIAHRDIKLDNIMLDENLNVKIIDFGTAFVFHYPFESTTLMSDGVVGSKPYVAPEVLTQKPYDPSAVDVWSCAIVYCCIALKRFPWKVPHTSDKRFNLYVTQRNDPNTKSQLIESLPMNSRDTIYHMLDIDFNTRCSISGARSTTWMQQVRKTLI